MLYKAANAFWSSTCRCYFPKKIELDYGETLAYLAVDTLFWFFNLQPRIRAIRLDHIYAQLTEPIEPEGPY